ncbi:MAG: alpha/beta hydrolase [Acidobacteria bacterium]|nr:alpha/beta hydrolase [Acidobacteriota bacterium]
MVEPPHQIPGPAGPLETILDRPAGDARAAVVFAHPLPTEGGTMHTKVASVKMSRKPKFIIHGERDELVSLRIVRHFYAQLHEPKELVEIDRANHLFEGQASEVGDALADLLEDFSCTTPSS